MIRHGVAVSLGVFPEVSSDPLQNFSNLNCTKVPTESYDLYAGLLDMVVDMVDKVADEEVKGEKIVKGIEKK